MENLVLENSDITPKNLSTVLEDPSIVLEDQILEDPISQNWDIVLEDLGIAPENSGIVLENLVAKMDGGRKDTKEADKSSIASENLVLEDPVAIEDSDIILEDLVLEDWKLENPVGVKNTGIKDDL